MKIGGKYRVLGPADFVHLDVISAFSKLASPNTPQEYVAELRRQLPFEDNAPADAPRPTIALADYGLQSTVKMAVAAADCAAPGQHPGSQQLKQQSHGPPELSRRLKTS